MKAKIFFLITLLVSFFSTTAQTVSWKSNQTTENAFVKNVGQFDQQNWNKNKVEFGIKQNHLHVFFTTKGLTYRFDKFIKNADEEEKSNSETPEVKNVSELINVTWLGSNNNVKIVAAEKVSHYYSYAVKNAETKKIDNLNNIAG